MAACAFVELRMPITSVYVDGFNLIYGALRKTPHRSTVGSAIF